MRGRAGASTGRALEREEGELRKFLVPKDPRGPYSLGLALAMQGKRPEAAKQFQAALTLAPGFVEPLAQLVTLKFAEKDGARGTFNRRRRPAITSVDVRPKRHDPPGLRVS